MACVRDAEKADQAELLGMKRDPELCCLHLPSFSLPCLPLELLRAEKRKMRRKSERVRVGDGDELRSGAWGLDPEPWDSGDIPGRVTSPPPQITDASCFLIYTTGIITSTLQGG